LEKTLRERRGVFFTPKIWADKSKEYLADVFGENWQDEYYIWNVSPAQAISCRAEP
jgi:hypothetical protein